MPPTISVVMPAYNAAPWIAEAVGSLQAQTLLDWELIVVDDESTDRTLEIVQGFDDRRITIRQQRHAGQSTAQNLGLGLARGEYLLFLDADDRLRPDALRHLSVALAQHPGACVAYGRCRYMREDGSDAGHAASFSLVRRPSGDVLRALLKRNLIWSPGSALLRIGCVRRVGGFRPGLVMAQDWELWCRLALIGDFVFAGRMVVLDYRLRKASLSRSVGADAESQDAAIRAVFDNPELHRRLGPRQPHRLERSRRAQALRFSAVELLRAGQVAAARRQLAAAIHSDPLSLRSTVLWLLAGPGRIPAMIRARLAIGLAKSSPPH